MTSSDKVRMIFRELVGEHAERLGNVVLRGTLSPDEGTRFR
jgi:hypothetical protein